MYYIIMYHIYIDILYYIICYIYCIYKHIEFGSRDPRPITLKVHFQKTFLAFSEALGL